jgi:outer membrane protein OmpA-like peptidoglycan-associated protein/opacity protein-like surface antigen
MRKAIIASLTAAALVVPGTALAEESMFHHNNPGAYFGFGLGANFLEDSRVDFFPGHSEVDSEIGTAALVTLGYRFSNGIRIEAEGGYRNNNLDSISNDLLPFDLDQYGHVNQYSLMGNLLYDFQLGSWFSPYVGAGAGVVWHSGGGDVGFGGLHFLNADLNDSAFAWQLIAGASAQLGGGLEGFVDYRYFSSHELDAEVSPLFGPPGSMDVGYDNDNHTVMVGLRYVFWSPKPMMAKPVAEPEPEPMAPKVEARSYLVFFDWDSAELTPEATSVIRAAADNIKRGGVSMLRVEVTGHADRSGPASYNVGLSQRRANAVRDALISMGVSGGVIGVDWKGETDPLVQTEDGVREPQNRRASIEVNT